jgi:hypothetical protein
MEMITVNVRGIKAASGMRLTNGEVYSDLEGTIYLGVNDSPDNWSEITEEEYQAILEEKTEKLDDVIEEEE